MSEKIGIVDAGGGMRGIYAAGLMDYCMDNDITFDLAIGVSAGSANLASFAAHQPRRNLQFYTEYAMRKEYMGLECFLRHRSFVDLDYVYGTLSNSDGENPLDYPYLAHNPMEFLVVATNALTGECKYFDKSDMKQDSYNPFKASSAIPFVCKPYVIDGIPYFDGALSDPVPIQKAFDWGCDKVVLVLTLPESTVRSPNRDRHVAARIRKKYPEASMRLENRAQTYNDSVELARRYAAEGKLIIVAPDDTCGVDTLHRDEAALRKLYAKGLKDGPRISEFLNR